MFFSFQIVQEIIDLQIQIHLHGLNGGEVSGLRDELRSKKLSLPKDWFSKCDPVDLSRAINCGAINLTKSIVDYFSTLSDVDLCNIVRNYSSSSSSSLAIHILMQRHKGYISLYVKKSSFYGLDSISAESFMFDAVLRAAVNYDKSRGTLFTTYLSTWLNRNCRVRSESWRSVSQCADLAGLKAFSIDALEFDITVSDDQGSVEKRHRKISTLRSAIKNLDQDNRQLAELIMAGYKSNLDIREYILSHSDINPDDLQGKIDRVFEKIRKFVEFYGDNFQLTLFSP